MGNRERGQLEEPSRGGDSGQERSAPPRAKGPTAAQVAASVTPELIENMRWGLANAQEIARHEGRWIVIARQRVYCSGDSLEEVEEQTLRGGLDKRDILVDCVCPFDMTSHIQ
ncbi:MAG: hypothetical protein FJ291_26365 [Planctomycetes bacterium]|nr:hypothetical protein [Planctomycetota bacterium]